MKLPFLPSLSFNTWFTLWAITITCLAGNWIGYWLDWWAYNGDVFLGCIVAFVLLSFTPLDHSQRMHWTWPARMLGLPEPPPPYDIKLTQVENARRILAWIDRYPHMRPDGDEDHVQGLRRMVALYDREQADGSAKDGDRYDDDS